LADDFSDYEARSATANETVRETSTVSEKKPPLALKCLNVTSENISEHKSGTSPGQNEESTLFKCHLCTSKYETYLKLLKHMGMRHFREKLQESYGDCEWECKLCKTNFEDERSLVRHIIVNHDPLQEIIPTKSSLQVKALRFEVSVKANQSSEEETLEKRTNVKAPNPKKSFYICHICNLKTDDYSTLISHISSMHFAKKMSEFMRTDDKRLECIFCKNVLSCKRSLIRHLALAHQVLKSFIPSREELSCSLTDLN